MTRILSGLVLLVVVIGTLWFLPPIWTLMLALLASALAFGEYAAIAAALGAQVPRTLAAAAVLAVCFVTGMLLHAAVALVLMTALVVFGALAIGVARPGPAVLADAAASLFGILYIGVPLGAIVAVRVIRGPEAVLLLMATIVVSDSAQYYGGRALGRRPLAPAISPKKTVEGAIAGVIFGTVVMAFAGRWLFSDTPTPILLFLGATIVLLGIAGDLFESLLKRSAGVKDSSALIPGHGGVLDRIDSWLFAAPVYYLFVLYTPPR